jgi:hypothetical protein
MAAVDVQAAAPSGDAISSIELIPQARIRLSLAPH